MMDNEQIVANLECNKSAFYYSMGHNQEVVREVFRNDSGKLFIRFPNWGLVPLGKDSPEVLIGKVPTSLELTTRISNLELSARYLKDVVALTREKVEQEYFAQLEKLEIECNELKQKLEAREELLIKFCLGDGDPFSDIKEALKKVIRSHEEKFIKGVKG